MTAAALLVFLIVHATAASVFNTCYRSGRIIAGSDASKWFACALATVPLETPVKFVQIGANDGVMGDPLHELMLNERNRRWHGVFVEPVPHLMARLQENKRPLVADAGFVQAAINGSCPDSGRVVFFMPVFQYGDPSQPAWVQGIGGLSVPAGRVESKTYKRIEVACLTPKQLAVNVTQYDALSPLFLLIDAEGFDVHILLSLREWPFGKPLMIVFEMWGSVVQNSPHLVADLLMHLNANGFVVIKAGADWIAILSK